MKSKGVLITGATGLLGAHLIQIGLQERIMISPVARSMNRRSYLDTVKDKVPLFEADLTREDITKIFPLNGIDTIIHCAGLASPRKEDEQKMRNINLGATQRLFKQAVESGVRNWVQVSSIATLQGTMTKNELSEEALGTPRETVYARTKYEAEKWLDQQRMNVSRLITVHPTYMLGPWDAKPSSGAIVFAVKMRKLKHFINVTKNFVSPKDVALGIWKALETGVSGHYILGHENCEFKVFVTKLLKALKMDTQSLKEILENELNTIKSESEKALLREHCIASSVSSQKAANDFGYQPKIGLDEMIKSAIDYFQEMKLLRI